MYITSEKEHLIKNELLIMKQIKHPNCVALIDEFENKEKFYILQELMSGSSLQE